jgi:mannose-6-phosphate isomerase-like protein (cupin superfamily)
LRAIARFRIMGGMPQDAWQIYDVAELKKRVLGPEPRFFEFLHSPRLSGAVYRLPAGARDLQGPHLEDEVYVVLEGRARLRGAAEDQDVRPGMILFIRADSRHSFVDIEEDLVLLAIFSATEKPWKS